MRNVAICCSLWIIYCVSTPGTLLYSFTNCLPILWTCKVIRMANNFTFYWPVLAPSSLSSSEASTRFLPPDLNQQFAVCNIDYLLLSNLLMWTAKPSKLVFSASFIRWSVIVHSNCTLLNHFLCAVNVRHELLLKNCLFFCELLSCSYTRRVYCAFCNTGDLVNDW